MNDPTTVRTTPEQSEPSAPTPTASTPRWLRVTAVSAAVASVLALAGVAVVARGGIREHREERMALADHAGPLGGSMGGRRADGVRGRMADRIGARRAEVMAERHAALAEALGVDVTELEAALTELTPGHGRHAEVDPADADPADAEPTA